MKNLSASARLATFAIAASLTTPVWGVQISTLYSTGVNSLGVPLPGGSIDPHWQLVVSPDPDYPGPGAFVLNDNAPLFGNSGTPNTSTSKWIGPRADGGHNFPRGDCTVGPCANADYYYETTFDLTGLNPATAQITGQWTMDDDAELLLNGASTGVVRPFAAGLNYRSFESFTVTTGFTAGINTLTVIVNNHFFFDELPRDNPTGMQIQLSGVAEIPEPASFMLALMAGAAFSRSRRCSSQR